MASLQAQTPAPVLGIIGGTGIQALAGFEKHDSFAIDTPFGPTSGELLLGTLHGANVVLLNRHGLLTDATSAQPIPPHAVNYRANIWALSRCNIQRVLAFNAVGGISSDWPPGRLGTPDDLIDYSSGRAQSFFDPDSPLGYHQHIEFTSPFSAGMSKRLQQAAQAQSILFNTEGVLAVTNGPRLETAAEVRKLEQDGCHLVGMTSMPEASLAAELKMEYVSLAFSVNWAAGKSPNVSGGIHQEIDKTLASCQAQIDRLLQAFIPMLAN